jgi:hypothetical protein
MKNKQEKVDATMICFYAVACPIIFYLFASL